MTGRLRLLRWRGVPPAGDLLLALLLTVLAQADLWYTLSRSTGIAPAGRNVALSLLQTVPVAGRRRAPLATMLVVVSAVALGNASDIGFVNASAGAIISALVCIYSVAAYGDRIRAVAGAIVAALGPPLFQLQLLPESWLLVGAAWLLGRMARRSWDSASEQAVAQERLRIARELHDVVAHNVTVVAVQAGAARLHLDTGGADRDHARAALTSIESKSRQALEEMRLLLGVLRPETGGAPSLSPQPSLQAIGPLIDEVREAGLDVELRLEGDARPLPPGLELSAYRIVQEALTNTLKHAGPTRARVLIRYGASEVDLEVVNEGTPAGVSARTAADAGGQGLVGMRERAALFGGTLRAGPRPGGGFEVAARLPLEPNGL